MLTRKPVIFPLERDPGHDQKDWKDPRKKDSYHDKLKVCMSPSHKFPSLLYIPPGESRTHTCPACGESQTVHAPMITC